MLSTISKTFESFLTHIVVAEYVTGLVPRGTHNYEKFLTPKDLTKILEEAGVDVLAVQELEYNWRG
jgi:2-polyprenyl-6-hydroxyphenyl methylase/3-demethylubiquinone-9 3-methyltransferase